MQKKFTTLPARFFLRSWRGIRFRLSALLVQPWLAALGISFTGRCVFVGFPIVDLIPGSTISIGKGSVLISKPFATALGVNHPVILRTLQTGAVIALEENVGISGATICAAKSVKIGAGSMLGANVIIADTDFHPLEPHLRKDSQLAFQRAVPVEIGKNVFLGTGAIILKGIVVGDNCVIGAGSVVTSSIPPNSIAAGNPCKVIRAADS